jgi:GT2 family glycosyltransferase
MQEARTGKESPVIDLSISIVNTDNRDLLAQCLASIYQTVQRASYEILVVDNCSTDGSAEMIRARFPAVQVIENEARLGYSASHNCALRRCQGRYLLVFNEDMRVLPGALDAMVVFMDAHPDAGMLGCRLLNPDGSLQPSCRAFPHLRIMLCRSLYLDKLFPRSRWFGADYLSQWSHDTVREVDVIKGCCMLVRREVVDQIGLLDERFFIYYEETDWCYRAVQQGWKVSFTPDAEVIHYGEQTTSRQSPRMTLIQRQSLLKYFRKHHGSAAAFCARLLSILETGSRLAYWSLNALLSQRRRAYATQKIGLYWPALRWLLTGQAATIR